MASLPELGTDACHSLVNKPNSGQPECQLLVNYELVLPDVGMQRKEFPRSWHSGEGAQEGQGKEQGADDKFSGSPKGIGQLVYLPG